MTELINWLKQNLCFTKCNDCRKLYKNKDIIKWYHGYKFPVLVCPSCAEYRDALLKVHRDTLLNTDDSKLCQACTLVFKLTCRTKPNCRLLCPDEFEYTNITWKVLLEQLRWKVLRALEKQR